MTSLSVLLIINNEEKQLKQCLERVSFADEIIVILDKKLIDKFIKLRKFKKTNN